LDLWRSVDAESRGRLVPLGDALGFRLDLGELPARDTAEAAPP
jgi:hypothetical protein